MKLFGKLTEFVKLIFRTTSGNQVTVEPNTTTASVGDVTFILPPISSGSSDLVDTNSIQTLSNKEIDVSTTTTVGAFTHGAQVDNPTSNVHGVVGNLVGTTDTQTLSGKSLDANSNIITGLRHGTEVDNNASGVHGVTGNIVGTSDVQELTNKSLVEQIAKGFITVEERVDDPSAPAAGFIKLYRKAAGLFFIESDGTVCQLESSTAPDLEDLSNVTIASPTQDNILIFNSTTQHWENVSIEDTISLNSLGDVDSVTTPNNGQVLQYSSIDSAWLNQDQRISEAVDTSFGSLGDGDVLVYRGGVGWENRNKTTTTVGLLNENVSGRVSTTHPAGGSNSFTALSGNASITFQDSTISIELSPKSIVGGADSSIFVQSNDAQSSSINFISNAVDFRLFNVTDNTVQINSIALINNAILPPNAPPASLIAGWSPSSVRFILPQGLFPFGTTKTFRIEWRVGAGPATAFISNSEMKVVR